SAIAAINKLVAIGRLMNVSEMFTPGTPRRVRLKPDAAFSADDETTTGEETRAGTKRKTYAVTIQYLGSLDVTSGRQPAISSVSTLGLQDWSGRTSAEIAASATAALE